MAQPTALPTSTPIPPTLLGLVEPAWLAENLGKADIRVLDVREQPRYDTRHIPGSLCVSPEHFRGVVNGSNGWDTQNTAFLTADLSDGRPRNCP